MKTIRLLIKGKVQGVFYRATAKRTAERFGINGWIKNTEEGDVEAEATGDEEALNAFIDWCKEGPANAHVTDVIIQQKELQEHDEFYIKR